MVTRAKRVAKTATEALKILWEDAFFTSWKQKGEVVEALAKEGNHFSDAELGMALMRANHLTRRGKRGHYGYIQKYKFIREEPNGDDNERGGKQ
jgi:hypothetical protein